MRKYISQPVVSSFQYTLGWEKFQLNHFQPALVEGRTFHSIIHTHHILTIYDYIIDYVLQTFKDCSWFQRQISFYLANPVQSVHLFSYFQTFWDTGFQSWRNREEDIEKQKKGLKKKRKMKWEPNGEESVMEEEKVRNVQRDIWKWYLNTAILFLSQFMSFTQWDIKTLIFKRWFLKYIFILE